MVPRVLSLPDATTTPANISDAHHRRSLRHISAADADADAAAVADCRSTRLSCAGMTESCASYPGAETPTTSQTSSSSSRGRTQTQPVTQPAAMTAAMAAAAGAARQRSKRSPARLSLQQQRRLQWWQLPSLPLLISARSSLRTTCGCLRSCCSRHRWHESSHISTSEWVSTALTSEVSWAVIS